MFSDSRDWESVDDFEQWNLSQVKALAKYRKGQGKFDYEFYEQTYYDLKRLSFFINGRCKVLEASDNDRWWRNKMDDYRRRVYGQDRISPYTKTNYQQMLDFSVWSNGLEYFLRVYNKLNSRLVDILNLKVDSVTVSSRTKPFGAKVLLKYAICSRLKKSDKQRLKDALKNMEKLRKTYPFKLKHLPTLTKWMGLEESQEKEAKGNIKVKVLKNDSSGYRSDISINLGDKIIYQELSIKPTGTEVGNDSLGMKELKRCYPANANAYPAEIRKIRPWNINGAASRGPRVSKFHTGNDVLTDTYDINFEILSIKPLDGREERNMDPYSDNIFGKDKVLALSFFREVMKQVGEYVKNNPWYIYSFFGIETDEEMDAEFADDHINKRTRIYLLSLRRLQRQLPGEWVVTYPEKGNANSIIFFRCPMSGLNEVSSMGGGAVQGFGAPFSKEEERLIQEMYSSAAIMGSGGGGFPKERSPEGHKRYVRIRFKRQGLQNFKPSRYFRSKDQQLGEKKNDDKD